MKVNHQEIIAFLITVALMIFLGGVAGYHLGRAEFEDEFDVLESCEEVYVNCEPVGFDPVVPEDGEK